MTFKPPPISSDARSVLTEELIARKASDIDRWRDGANLATQWNDRAKLAAALIGAGPSRVLDVGAGDMALKGFLAPACDYLPCDIVKRSDDCLVADLNKQEFPAGDYDVVSFLGVLEYVHDPAWALAAAAKAAPRLVVTYCADTAGNQAYRRGLGWVNDYTKDGFEALLREVNWSAQACVEYKRGATNTQYAWSCVRATGHGVA